MIRCGRLPREMLGWRGGGGNRMLNKEGKGEKKNCIGKCGKEMDRKRWKGKECRR